MLYATRLLALDQREADSMYLLCGEKDWFLLSREPEEKELLPSPSWAPLAFVRSVYSMSNKIRPCNMKSLQV